MILLWKKFNAFPVANRMLRPPDQKADILNHSASWTVNPQSVSQFEAEKSPTQKTGGFFISGRFLFRNEIVIVTIEWPIYVFPFI